MIDALFSFFLVGFIASIVVGLVLPLVGALILLRRTAFLGVATPQFSAAGVAAGFFALPLFPAIAHEHIEHGHPPMWYLLAFAGLGAATSLIFFAWLEARDRLGSSESRLAAGFALATAVSVLFLSVAPIGDNYLHTLMEGGQILMLDMHGMEIVVAVFVLTLVGLARWRRAFLLCSFDPSAAISLGHKLARYERRQNLIIGFAVAGGVMTVGPVLVFGLLFLPPLGARRLARNVTGYVIACSAIGVLSVLVAWPVSLEIDWPFGPAAVLAAAVCSFVVWFAGWLRDQRGEPASTAN